MDNSITSYAVDDIEIMEPGYSADLNALFSLIPPVAKPLFTCAERALERTEQLLYSAPSFISVIKATIPKEALQAILSNEQKEQLRNGALKLMSKKDGSLLATLVDPTSNQIVSTIPLEKVQLSPDILHSMSNYATQMQMMQIAEQIQQVQIAIEEVHQGQEHDRLATAYSCQQKLLQAITIKNPSLRSHALLQIASAAEDSRNLLMQSQSANAAFLQKQPESFWKKLISGASPEKIDARMAELRESLCAVNMVSLTEAIAYQEMREPEAAQVSLQYYADYIQRTYLSTSGFVDRLDMIDPSSENYWSKTLPEIKKRINTLPIHSSPILLEEYRNDTKNM